MGGRVLPTLLYGADHPYGRPFSGLGNTEVVKGLSREDLVGFHDAWLRPDNARIFVVSDKPLSELKTLLDSSFGA